MFQTLTKEEALLYNSREMIKTNEWWNELSDKEKKYLYDSYMKLFKQTKCKHSHLNKIPYYNRFIYYYKDCNIDFTESEIRDEKINNILKGDN